MILSELSRKNRKKNVTQAEKSGLLRDAPPFGEKRVELFMVSWYPKVKF